MADQLLPRVPNGGSISPNGGSIFQNGGSIFQNGVSIFRSMFLGVYSYNSSSQKSVVATNNGLLISSFGTIVALVAPFLRSYLRARECARVGLSFDASQNACR